MLSCLGSEKRLNDVAWLYSAVKVGHASAVKSKVMQNKRLIKTGLLMAQNALKRHSGTPKNILHKDSRHSAYVSLQLSIYILGTVPAIMGNSGLGIILLDFVETPTLSLQQIST